MEKKRFIQSSNNLHSKGILNTKLHHQHPLQYLNMLFTHESSIEILLGIFLVAQLVKNPTAMQETLVWSLGWEDPLEGDKATHSSILAWRIPWTEDPGGLQSTGSTESDATEQLSTAQCSVHSRTWDTSETTCKKEQDTCSGSGKLLYLLTYYGWDFHTLGKNNQVNNNVFTQHYLAKISMIFSQSQEENISTWYILLHVSLGVSSG